MLIQCKLKRAGGTVIELGDTSYHFKPNDKGDHVAEVTDDDHADTLLAITEGYAAYEQEPATGEQTAPAVSSGEAKATRTRKSTKPAEASTGGDEGQGE